MTLSPKLALRQTTALVMTPQLQQAIKLLQLSNQELATYIDSEVERNPLLERETPEGGLEPAAEPASSGADSDTAQREEDGIPVARTGEEDAPPRRTDADEEPDYPDSADLSSAERLPDAGNAPLDTDYGNVWTDDSNGANETPEPVQFSDWGSGGSFEGSGLDFEERLSGAESFRDHLTMQVNVEIASPEERLIAVALIDSLDEAGYLSVAVDEVAERLGIAGEAVAAVLARVQRFDPPGVFARDLAECLALQLRERNRLDPAMQALVEHLDLLARRDLPALRRICGVDEEDLSDMIHEIRALDPKPGLIYSSEVLQTVIPDILVRAKPDGGWHVELNADTLPRVLVNQTYFAEVKQAARNKSDRDYLTDCMQSANWLVRALHQRATTILKVATEIVRAQGTFLTHGVQHLRPLTLRDIADAIGMHESTVSRVTANKFMATPRGLFELKYFFTSAIGSNAGGASHSAESVRHRIRELIDRETAKTVLSDDKIVDILSGEGIEIARRTVAKYREAMRIPSSSQRRREKAISL